MKKLVCVLAVVALSGCASIVNDKNQQVKIVASNGQTLQGSVKQDTVTSIKEDGKLKKVHNKTVAATFNGTNNTVDLPRSNLDTTVTVENAECAKETPIERSVAPAFWGNIILGGLLGSTTDSATGKMWKYQEDVVVSCK